MRLKKLHIENFGKLSDLSISFDEGKNVFLEDNAWGKSTLAAFIKVMFYGFENERARAGLKSERVKFRPWQTGVYGGQLEFEAEGKHYIIEKTFGSRTKEDVYILRDADTNIPIDNIDPSCIGENFFHVDSASFKRSIFVFQNDVVTSSTDGISAKIGNMTDATDDINNYESAVARLDRKIIGLSPDRKTGDLFSQRSIIQALSTDLLKEKALDQQITTLEERQSAEEKELETESEHSKNLIDLQKQLSIFEKRLEQKRFYTAINNDYMERKERFRKVENQLPASIPQIAQIDTYIEKVRTIDSKRATQKEYELTKEEKEDLQMFREQYDGQIPTNEDLVEAKKKLDNAEDLQMAILSRKMSEDEKREFALLSARFEDTCPGEEEIKGHIQAWQRRNEIKSSLSTKRAAAELAKTAAPNKQSVDVNLFLIIGIVCIVSGIISFLMKQVIIGGVSALVGGIFVVIGILRSKNRKQSPKNEAIDNLSNELAQEEAYVQTIESEIYNFLSSMHVEYNEQKVLDDLYTLLSDRKKYDMLSRKASETNSTEEEQAYQRNISDVRKFLMQYGITPNEDNNRLDDDLLGLSARISTMRLLEEKELKFTEAEVYCADSEKEILKFLDELRIPVSFSIFDTLLQLKNVVSEYKKEKVRLDEARVKVAKYEQETEDLDEILSLEKPNTDFSLTEINQMIEAEELKKDHLRKSIAARERQLNAAQENYSDLMEKKAELEERKEKLRKDEAYYDNLKQARRLLEEAKQNLSSRYTDPIKHAFDKYFSLIAENEENHFIIDSNSRITTMECGEQRNVESLSVGYQDLVGVCLRMAFIDAMYQSEKPFLIFDDPFVNLDAEKLQNAKKFLDKISEKHQIIYFTCHESRA